MAIIVKEKDEAEKPWITTYVHKCGEIVWAKTVANRLICYLDSSKHIITQCPHCMRDLEWEDIQLASNVKLLGWPI